METKPEEFLAKLKALLLEYNASICITSDDTVTLDINDQVIYESKSIDIYHSDL